MSRITQDLLRKRAEHNEGLLDTLEEISLHQQDIEKIENLEKFCRHLKILYLQNNLIPKMENLNKLKELEYLNIGLNNISKIEGIKGCESLRKLDMTLNFMDIEDLKESIANLSLCSEIRELYTTGNPCEEWSGYKDYVIAKIPQLTRLNGTDILKSDRIKALQDLKFLELDLEKAALQNIQKKKDTLPNPNGYTKESRVKMYQELQQKKQEEENKSKESSMFNFPEEAETKPAPVYNDKGDIYQCNQGKYKFKIDDDPFSENIVFELRVPKYMDTSLLDVDLHPLYIRVTLKNKVTQLKFMEEIIVEKSKVQRSQTTGALVVTCPKQKFDFKKREKILKKREQEEKLLKNQKDMEQAHYTKLVEGAKAVDIRHILKSGENEEDMIKEIESTKIQHSNINQRLEEIQDLDLDDLPELE